MRKTVIALFVLLLPMLLLAQPEESEDAIDSLLDTIDLTEWDEWFQRNGSDTGILPSALMKQLLGMQTPFGEDVTQKDFVSWLKPSIKPVLAKTALLVGLAAVGAALRGLSDASSIGETAETTFRIIASTAVIAFTLTEIRTAFSAVATVERASELLLPVITGYLTLIGHTNTAMLLPVSCALLSDVVLKTIETCVMPMAITGGVLSVIDASGTGRLNSVGKLFQRAAKWILGTACSLYMVVTAIRSATAKAADGLLIKTTKLAAGSIPAIGSLLSESVDTAYQCMHFVKNMLGLTGCMVLISVTVKPVISVFLERSSLRAAALLSEPLSGKPYADLLRGMGDTLHILMLAELAALAMPLVMLAPVFTAGT